MRYINLCIMLVLWVSLSYAQKKQNPSVATLQAAIDKTMAEARHAVKELGATDSAMIRIQAALAKLASKPGLKERANLSELHGSSSVTAAKLAGDGEDEITLFVVRFDTGTATPVHDHLTWGVIYVLEGIDRYVQWERADDRSNPGRAELRVKYEKTLEPNDSVYWLEPPQDIHSQESISGPVWELVLAGKNLMGEIVTNHRHYFDPETGRVSEARSQQ